jgi:hypothetical protein
MIYTSKHIGDNGSKSKVHAMPDDSVDGHKAKCGRKVQWLNNGLYGTDHEITCLPCIKVMEREDREANTDKFIAESDARLAAAGISTEGENMRIVGIQNYSGENVFTCTNCVASSSWARDVFMGEDVVCCTCGEMLGYAADFSAAIREDKGRKLVAEEDRWYMLDKAHGEALKMNSDLYMLALAERHETITDNRLYHTPLNRWEYHIRGLYVSLQAIPVIDWVCYRVTKSGNPSKSYETYDLVDAIATYEAMIGEHMHWLEVDRLDREWHYSH